MSAKRALDGSEIDKIIRAGKINKRHIDELNKWPGDDNMALLTEAVNSRKQFVEFDNGFLFTIRYDDLKRMVFISPSSENLFMPCGYFEYDRLKGVIA